MVAKLSARSIFGVYDWGACRIRDIICDSAYLNEECIAYLVMCSNLSKLQSKDNATANKTADRRSIM